MSSPSISLDQSFLEKVNDALGLFPDEVYSVFPFEPTPNLRHGISRLFKNFVESMLDS